MKHSFFLNFFSISAFNFPFSHILEFKLSCIVKLLITSGDISSFTFFLGFGFNGPSKYLLDISLYFLFDSLTIVSVKSSVSCNIIIFSILPLISFLVCISITFAFDLAPPEENEY